MPSFDVLRFFPESEKPPSRGTVKRHYLAWRREQGLPVDCCDRQGCAFESRTIEWMGRLLSPELDHIDGAARDNRPKNLRLLCPMCHRSEPTYAGANAGRVVYSAGGKQIRDRATGKSRYSIIAEPGRFNTTSAEVRMTVVRAASDDKPGAD